MKRPITEQKLNTLLTVPLEQWHAHGVALAAVSANADGMVVSGITKRTRQYFFKRWDYNPETNVHSNPRFILE